MGEAEPQERAESRPSSSHSSSSSSSATRTPASPIDPQAHSSDFPSEKRIHLKPKTSYFSIVFDQAGVDDAVLYHNYRGQGTFESPYLVDFIPNDSRNAQNFPEWRKWLITVTQAIATLAVTFTSSAYSGSVIDIVKTFHVSDEVVILGVSLFVLGFAIGPLLWAPFSEMYGRQKLFFLTYMALTAFNAGAAGSPNMASLIILRFFAGAFGSSPLTNAGGVIADLFNANERGVATSIFAMAPFLGPALGPIAGGFLGQASGFRWVEGMCAIFTGVVWIIGTFICPETYAPVLLRQRAEKLSKITGKHYRSKFEAGKPPAPPKEQFKVALLRPWILLFKEPIVLLLSIYMAIIYGTLYMCFAAFPIVYQQGRGWNPGVGGLSFIGIAVGMLFGTGVCIWDNKRYVRVAEAHNGAAPPEARLPLAIFGSVFLPVGLFWFAWTNGPSTHWIVSIIGSAFFALGIVMVFLSLMVYLIDAYVIYAASALAANSVLRSLFGTAFPLFTTYMYRSLGVHWASSIPAFLALVCVPFPLVFYKYGKAIRMKCKFASEAAAVLEKIRAMQEPAENNNSDGDLEEKHANELHRHTSNVVPA